MNILLIHYIDLRIDTLYSQIKVQYIRLCLDLTRDRFDRSFHKISRTILLIPDSSISNLLTRTNPLTQRDSRRRSVEHNGTTGVPLFFCHVLIELHLVKQSQKRGADTR